MLKSMAICKNYHKIPDEGYTEH